MSVSPGTIFNLVCARALHQTARNQTEWEATAWDTFFCLVGIYLGYCETGGWDMRLWNKDLTAAPFPYTGASVIALCVLGFLYPEDNPGNPQGWQYFSPLHLGMGRTISRPSYTLFWASLRSRVKSHPKKSQRVWLQNMALFSTCIRNSLKAPPGTPIEG